jgi:FkbM family methyltransferase
VSAYCDLYEPDPRNLDKLRTNLSAFRDRFTLHETAVAETAGVMPFYRESTGRYGRLGTPEAGREALTVRVEHINTVLERALIRNGYIDLLKIDTEGSELATIRAIDPQLRERIRYIVIESCDHNISLDGFRADFQCDTVRFSSRALSVTA